MTYAKNKKRRDFWCSDQEWEAIEVKRVAAGCKSRQEYMRAMTIDGKINRKSK